MSTTEVATHQPREGRTVPCDGCSRPTLNVHRVCRACDARAAISELSATCERCAGDPIAAVWPEHAPEPQWSDDAGVRLTWSPAAHAPGGGHGRTRVTA
jgi:hypothetical protein